MGRQCRTFQQGNARATDDLAVPGRSDRGAPGDPLDLDAACDLSDHESRGRGSSALVRSGRARCAWSHQRAAGCVDPLAQVRRALRARAPVDCPGEHELRTRRRAEPDRELREYADPALLGLRRGWNGPVCLAPDRRTGGGAPGALGQPIAWCQIRRWPRYARAQRADGDRACGLGGRDRAAAGPDGVFEVRLTTRVDAGGLSGVRD